MFYMQRFKKGDPVLIVPKFADLYPGRSGVVLDVKTDPFRPMLNGYTIKFPSGATENVFEFQLIEDPPNYQTLIAAIAFDTQQHRPVTHMRGPEPHRRFVLQAPPYDVDLKVQTSKTQALILGQVLKRSTSALLKPLEVSLIKPGTLINKIASDSEGMFKFSNVPRGPTSILVVIPEDFCRVLGEISI